MRLSLKRVLQWVLCLVLLQIVIYYWTTKKKHVYVYNIQEHKVLPSILQSEGTCSFAGCPEVKENDINVHLIPHTHIDVGWTKSVQQYYIGETVPNVWASGCVRCTLNATITELFKDKSRRFIFVEMKYLARYWDEIDDRQRADILQLIKERRLEIISGGWVSSDAAVTMYNDIIDQHTLGFDFIREKLGACAQPRTAWHADQFGHSREHASIFAQMGFNSLFLGRLDFQDFKKRTEERNLELVWMTSPKNLKLKSHLFTHVIYESYNSPEHFNFEIDTVSWSDPKAAEQRAQEFLDIIKQRMRGYRTNHLLIPMGCDFAYQAAANWFVNIEGLMQAVNKLQANVSPKINLIYSTPSCYTYHVNQQNVKFPVKFDDFHPYGIEPGVYWTGLFTSRGGLKMHIKRAGQILQSCKQLSIFTGQDKLFNKVNKLRDVMGVMQHHDAITGTQRREVLKDYNQMLSDAIQQCEAVMSVAYGQLRNQDSDSDKDLPPLELHFCHDLNISSCEVSEGDKQFLISLYNPLSWPVDVPVRFPVKAEEVTVVDGAANNIPVQLVPVPDQVTTIPERKSNSHTEAVFQAHIPPMSAVSFSVKPQTGKDQKLPNYNATSEGFIENEHLLLKFNMSTGRLMSMFNKQSKLFSEISQDFAFYTPDLRDKKTSGAYLFVPLQRDAELVTQAPVEIKVIKGKIVQEVHQKFNNWVSQVVRIYQGAKFAEFQWVVGPLENSNGIEVISRFTSDFHSANNFFTDSNGREMLMRIRKKAQDTPKIYNSISGNYYPVTSKIFIQDDAAKKQLTILPDRPQGGSSLSSGSVELLVHRRSINDDDLGLAEPLLDNGVDGKGIIFTGKHYVCLESIDKSATLVKHLALQIHLAPVPMFAHLNDDRYTKLAPKEHNFLHSALPDNVHILTLDRISENESDFFIIRLEHLFEEKEDPLRSMPVDVSLEDLFWPFKIVYIEETTLGGNFRPSEIHRLTWETIRGATLPTILSDDYKAVRDPPFTIKLWPMEIRTFRIQIIWRNSLPET
ncbi:hypothetical protein BsWGS_20530 [Bradybaena similaris]